MEKEKIRFGRVLIISILLSITMFYILKICDDMFCHVSDSHIVSSNYQPSPNEQFEVYFGNSVPGDDVKRLLSLVRTNNITSDEYNEDKKIYINSKDSTVSGVNGIGIMIKNEQYYTVEIMNEQSTSPETPIGNDSNSNQGYYNNGLIRNIRIELNKNSNMSNSIEQNIKK